MIERKTLFIACLILLVGLVNAAKPNNPTLVSPLGGETFDSEVQIQWIEAAQLDPDMRVPAWSGSLEMDALPENDGWKLGSDVQGEDCSPVCFRCGADCISCTPPPWAPWMCWDVPDPVIADATSVSGGILTLDTTSTAEHEYYWRLEGSGNDWYDNVSNITGWTVEARIKVDSVNLGEGAGSFRNVLTIRIDDHTYAKNLYITEDGIYIRDWDQWTSYTFDTTDAFHTYRITGKGEENKVYIDGKLVLEVRTRLQDEMSFGKKIIFGDWSVFGSNKSKWDYIRYYTGGAIGEQDVSYTLQYTDQCAVEPCNSVPPADWEYLAGTANNYASGLSSGTTAYTWGTSLLPDGSDYAVRMRAIDEGNTRGDWVYSGRFSILHPSPVTDCYIQEDTCNEGDIAVFSLNGTPGLASTSTTSSMYRYRVCCPPPFTSNDCSDPNAAPVLNLQYTSASYVEENINNEGATITEQTFNYEVCLTAADTVSCRYTTEDWTITAEGTEDWEECEGGVWQEISRSLVPGPCGPGCPTAGSECPNIGDIIGCCIDAGPPGWWIIQLECVGACVPQSATRTGYDSGTGPGAFSVTVSPQEDGTISNSEVVSISNPNTSYVVFSTTDNLDGSQTITGNVAVSSGGGCNSAGREIGVVGIDRATNAKVDEYGASSIDVCCAVGTINDPPVFDSFSLSVEENSPTQTEPLNQYVQDEDPATLTYRVELDDPSEVDCEINGQNLEYTPATDWTGTAFCILEVTDNASQPAYAAATITVNPAGNQAPTATLTATPTSGDTPLTVTFTGGCSDSDGTIQSCEIDFGDGSISQAFTDGMTNEYTTGATIVTYTATLTATDNDWATGIATATITVNPIGEPQPQPGDVWEVSVELDKGFYYIGGDNPRPTVTIYNHTANQKQADLTIKVIDAVTHKEVRGFGTHNIEVAGNSSNTWSDLIDLSGFSEGTYVLVASVPQYRGETILTNNEGRATFSLIGVSGMQVPEMPVFVVLLVALAMLILLRRKQ